MLANAKWQNVRLAKRHQRSAKARFAAVRVRTADGPPQRIKDLGQQHLPGDEPGSSANTGRRERRNLNLANLPARTNLRTLVRHDQSPMDLRTGSSAVERGTRA
jgi:hypothetical protein